MKVALYKGPGNFYDKLIRIATFSKYSHCELVISNVSYSSSPRDGGVRKKYIDFKPEHWDFVEVEGNPARALTVFNLYNGAKYDLWGAVKTVIPFFRNSSDKWFCSEIVALALELPNPRKWKPKDFMRIAK